MYMFIKYICEHKRKVIYQEITAPEITRCDNVKVMDSSLKKHLTMTDRFKRAMRNINRYKITSYRDSSNNNDGIFDIRIRTWRILQDIQDGTHRRPVANPLGN